MKGWKTTIGVSLLALIASCTTEKNELHKGFDTPKQETIINLPFSDSLYDDVLFTDLSFNELQRITYADQNISQLRLHVTDDVFAYNVVFNSQKEPFVHLETAKYASFQKNKFQEVIHNFGSSLNHLVDYEGVTRPVKYTFVADFPSESTSQLTYGLHHSSYEKLFMFGEPLPPLLSTAIKYVDKLQDKGYSVSADVMYNSIYRTQLLDKHAPLEKLVEEVAVARK